MTLWSAVALLFLTLALGVAGWLLFMWGVKSGQFDDIEGPKYRIFDDDDLPISEDRGQKREDRDEREE